MKVQDFFLSRKRNEKTETLNLMRLREVIERTLFRWEIIVRSNRWKWVNFAEWKLREQYESNSDAFADAFADEKNFLLMMQLMLSIVRWSHNRCLSSMR